MDGQWPDTDLQDYCRSCMRRGGCDACPRPRLLPAAEPATWALDVCGTQWRTDWGRRTGIDYAACTAALAQYLPRWRAEAGDDGAPIHALEVVDLLDGLRVIEDTLLAIDAAKRAEEHPES